MIQPIPSDGRVSPVQAIRAVARGLKLPARSGVAPAVVAGGLIATGDPEWVDPLLARYGATDPQAVRRSIASLTVAGDGDPPRVKLDGRLPSELKQQLCRLDDDQPQATRAALETLMSLKLDDEVRWLLRDPADFCRNYRGAGSRPDDKGELLRRLARFYGPRVTAATEFLGECRIGDGIPPLARKEAPERIDLVCKRFEDQRNETFELVFSRPAYSDSPFGKVWNEFGETAAHIFGIATLAELGLVGGKPTVRDITAAISLKYFHRYLSPVQQAIGSRLYPEWVWVPRVREYVWFDAPVFPAKEALDRVTDFLTDEPISDEEAADILAAID